MTKVIVEGVYMGANVRTSTFDGVTKSAVYIDVYQPELEAANKTVQLKAEDMSVINKLNEKFKMGVPFRASAQVNAYKNQAYFRFLELA